MNKLKAILCAALCACIIAVPLVSTTAFRAGAEEASASIDDRIAELDKKSAEYQAFLDANETDINEKEAYGNTLLSKISVMNEKIILTRQSIAKLNTDIKKKQAELEKGNSEIDSQIDALCNRLAIIYMAGSASNLEILLGAKDFGDFIDKVSLVKSLSDYDRQMIDEVNSQLTVIDTQKKKLESDKAKLEKDEATLSKDISDLQKLVDKNKAVLADLTAKSRQARAALQNANSKSAELEAEVAKVFHREFSRGLYFGRPGVDQFADSQDSLSTLVKRHAGIVVDYFLKAGIAQVQIQDHPLAVGDAVQIHGPTTGVVEVEIDELRRDDERLESVGKGEWATFRAPRCRVGDKVFFMEERKGEKRR